MKQIRNLAVAGLRRRSALKLGLAVGLGAAIHMARGQATFPNRPLKLVVPFPAGNTADIVARLLAEQLGPRLGQPVVVDNRPGAAGSIGVDAVAKAPADGHTLLVTTSSPLVLNPLLYKKLPYSVEADLASVAILGHLPTILVVNSQVPAANVAELVAYLKANPGKLSYASNGTGSFAHVAMEAFKSAAGVDVVHVPYKGTSQADADMIAGHVQMMFTSLVTSATLVATGRLKPLGVTSRARSPYASGVPTLTESGIPALGGFDVTYWVGVLAPAATPAPVLGRLGQELGAVMRLPAFAEQLEHRKILPAAPLAAGEIDRVIAREREQWARTLRVAGIERQDL